MYEYNDLFDFWINLLIKYTSFNESKLQQISFLKDLMNGFKVNKKYMTSKNEYKAEDLYIKLLGNQKYTVYNIFLKTPTNKNNKKIYLQAQTLFDLREQIFKKLFDKGIIQDDYEKNIGEKTKLKNQRLREIEQ